MNKTAAGKALEDRAAEYLCARGYRILCRNYRTRRAEIDIIAMDGKVICFVEVRGRQGRGFGEPEDSISRVKQSRICRGAIEYLKEQGLLDRAARFDVVAVRDDGGQQRVKLMKDAFELTGDY